MVFRFSRLAGLLLLVFMFGFGFAITGRATEPWVLFTSQSDLFRIRLPQGATEKITPFRVSLERLLQQVEVSSVVTGHNTQKHYTVLVDQTLGPAISNGDKNLLIKREFARYEAQYRSRGGRIHSQKMLSNNGAYAGEIHLSYDDPDLGKPQAVRALITVTDSAKFQQIVTGPQDAMFSFKTKDFFSSLKIRPIKKNKETSDQDWGVLESPFKLFKIQIHPPTLPFFSGPPDVQHGDKTEMIAQVFTDPVWNYNIYYKIYGYRFGQDLSLQNVQQVMVKNHIKKHGRDARDLTFTQSFAGGVPSLETTYRIRSPEGYGYINQVRLRALFLDNAIVVQEAMSVHFLVQSDFMRNTFDLIDFSPKKGFKAQALERLQGMMEAP